MDIYKKFSKEKICTWKSAPATKDCNMEIDKGCKLTKLDKIEEETIYLFIRKVTLYYDYKIRPNYRFDF